MIGIGGVGCALLSTLARFLNFSDKEVEITLIDGDDFEIKNQYRQSFNKLGNKAEITAERLEKEFTKIYFRSKARYVTEETVGSLIREGDIIFLCVDNHATRKVVSDYCGELSDMVLISGGNDWIDGNVQVYLRKNGEDVTLPLTNDYHPEIQNPRDKNPGEAGCGELAESKPQLLIMNNAIAAAMLNSFYVWFTGKLKYDEVYIDIMSGNARSVRRDRA